MVGRGSPEAIQSSVADWPRKRVTVPIGKPVMTSLLCPLQPAAMEISTSCICPLLIIQRK